MGWASEWKSQQNWKRIGGPKILGGVDLFSEGAADLVHCVFSFLAVGEDAFDLIDVGAKGLEKLGGRGIDVAL